MHSCTNRWLFEFIIVGIMAGWAAGQAHAQGNALPSPTARTTLQARADLPDAPAPQQPNTQDATNDTSRSSSAPDAAPGQTGEQEINQQQTAKHVDQLPYAPLYARTIFTDKQARPLLGLDKLRYTGEEMLRPINLLHAGVSAEFSQFQGGDPKYGSGFGSYSQRFGAAMLREATYRVFSDGLFPIILREDPRYYRMDHGGGRKRFVYAFTRTFVTRDDAGQWVPNYATFLGHAAGAALTLAYYPATSQGGGVVLRTFGDSIAVQIGLDLVREFVPSLRWLL